MLILFVTDMGSRGKVHEQGKEGPRVEKQTDDVRLDFVQLELDLRWVQKILIPLLRLFLSYEFFKKKVIRKKNQHSVFLS